MTQDELKQAVAKAAVDHIAPHLEPSSIVGVGTGSTANFFIDYLAEYRNDFDGAGFPGRRIFSARAWPGFAAAARPEKQQDSGGRSGKSHVGHLETLQRDCRPVRPAGK